MVLTIFMKSLIADIPLNDLDELPTNGDRTLLTCAVAL